MHVQPQANADEGTDAMLSVHLETTGKKATLRLDQIEILRPTSDVLDDVDDSARVYIPTRCSLKTIKIPLLTARSARPPTIDMKNPPPRARSASSGLYNRADFDVDNNLNPYNKSEAKKSMGKQRRLARMRDKRKNGE